jgi:hypothetical protein
MDLRRYSYRFSPLSYRADEPNSDLSERLLRAPRISAWVAGLGFPELPLMTSLRPVRFLKYVWLSSDRMDLYLF